MVSRIGNSNRFGGIVIKVGPGLFSPSLPKHHVALFEELRSQEGEWKFGFQCRRGAQGSHMDPGGSVCLRVSPLRARGSLAVLRYTLMIGFYQVARMDL